MEYIFSFSIFSLLPLFGSVCLLFLTMYGHLTFKLIDIKIVQMASAVLGGIFGFVFFVSMYQLNVNFNVLISEIHYLATILFFGLNILLGFYTRRIIPNINQIVGLCLFGAASLFLLV